MAMSFFYKIEGNGFLQKGSIPRIQTTIALAKCIAIVIA